VALSRRGQLDEAIACFEKAIALDTKSANAHNNLGNALKDKDQLDEAIASYKKAIVLDPKHAEAQYNLGLALYGKRQLDEAIASYKKATELNPEHANAHNNLGNALKANAQVVEAIASYKKAITLDPKNALFHTNLGVALAENGQLDDAITCFEKAIAVDPKHALGHYNLGSALALKGQLDKAIACYHEAIALDPRHPESHCNLGGALASQGRFAESLPSYKRGHELGMKQTGWRYPSAEWVRQAEVKAAMEAKLPAFLKGEFQPGDNNERLALAAVCQCKRLNHAATVLYSAAFAADPKLADDLGASHRYNAACFAALAAAGQGEDTAQLDDKERARLRQQGLDWLRADLALYAKQLETGKPADRAATQRSLRHWQQDSDLAGLRDAAALARLAADEQKVSAQLWSDVAATLKKADK
jgi:Tfp pilus assembly protein PilF